MQLRVTSAVDESDWQAQMEALQAPIFHSPVWARYSETGKAGLHHSYCSLVDKDGRVRGIALLFRLESQNPILRHLSSALHCDAHPTVEQDDPELFSEFVRQLEAHARSTGAVELTIGSFGTPGHRGELEQLKYQLRDRYEFVLPLNRTDEEIRSAMERRRRRTIQKAVDVGVTVEPLEFEEGIAGLRYLQEFTSERLKKRGANVDFGPRRESHLDPVGELMKGGRADLVGARFEGRLVSVSLYTKMNGLVYSTLAGHAPEAYELNAYTLLLWTVMRRYREEGHQRLNIGGVAVSATEEGSLERGLYEYKAGLGGMRDSCTTASKILKPMRHRALQKLRSVVQR